MTNNRGAKRIHEQIGKMTNMQDKPMEKQGTKMKNKEKWGECRKINRKTKNTNDKNTKTWRKLRATNEKQGKVGNIQKNKENQWQKHNKWRKWRKTMLKSRETNGKHGRIRKIVENQGTWKENLSKPKSKKKNPNAKKITVIPQTIFYPLKYLAPLTNSTELKRRLWTGSQKIRLL